MPFFQAMAERANEILNRRHIGKLDPKAFDQRPLGEIATTLGVGETDAERAFLATFPPSIEGAMKAVLHNAVARRLPVTIAWAPGYDFELLVAEGRTTKDSLGGVTLFLRTRYPGD